MQKFLVSLMLLAVAASAVPAFAGGDVYFSKFIASNYTVMPTSTKNAAFVSGVYLDKSIPLSNEIVTYVKPWVRLETYMDKYNGNFNFHPAAIRYDVGVELGLYKGTYAELSRMCWHPIAH